jgi:DNA-binding transcriptional LysR family regulator
MDRLTAMTVFARVAEAGGFSAAARRLNLSTTMVSNHVQSLENHLGARLLNRTTRKVSLTEVGRAYYERCSRILADLADADRAAGELQSMPRGTLKMHVASAHIVRFIAPVVSEYLALYPDASIDFSAGERRVDMIEEGFDLMIRVGPSTEASLIVRNLVPWRHTLCCAPDYLASHPAPRVPEDLKQHNCLRYAHYFFGNEWHFTAPSGSPASVEISGNLVSSSGETLLTCALAGQGLFLAPGFIAGEELERGNLVPLMRDYRPVEFTINAIYPTRHHLSAKVRIFIDLLAVRLSNLRRWMDYEAMRDRDATG